MTATIPTVRAAAPARRDRREIEDTLEEYFTSIGVPTRGTDFDGRSDYGPFIANGIPAGGIFTGAEGRKTAAQVQLWGGTAAAFDPCYHRACDTHHEHQRHRAGPQLGRDRVHGVDARRGRHHARRPAQTGVLGHLRDGHRLDREPVRHRHRHLRALRARRPGGHQLRRGHPARHHGERHVSTWSPGPRPGASAGANDVDGGTTTIRSPAITLPTGTLTLSFSWYLVAPEQLEQRGLLPGPGRRRARPPPRSSPRPGAASDRAAAWQTATVNLSSVRRAERAAAGRGRGPVDGEPGGGGRRRRQDHQGLRSPGGTARARLGVPRTVSSP